MNGSFHGRTLATLTATGNDKVKQGFAPLPAGFVHVPFNDIAALERVDPGAGRVAGVLIEVIQGEGGVVVAAPGYLRAVRDLCDQRGWLLMIDEVQTGMCRTGHWFACQGEGVRPDVITLAKSLGNGLPIGACLVAESVAGVMGSGSHGSTFGGNPLVTRAALAVIDVMRSGELAARATELGDMLRARLDSHLAVATVVRDIRGRGLMIGIETARPCGAIVDIARRRHLLVNVTAGNVVRLLPPLIISAAEALQIADQTAECVLEFESQCEAAR